MSSGFVDEVRLHVKAGDGGNGSVAFRRETHVPFGGPAGGDGGRGGSVIFLAEQGRTSLLELSHLPLLKAKRGEHGRGRDQYGKAGADLTVKVPLGTQVFDEASNELIADLDTHAQSVVVAKGGQGGRGNKHFATPFDRAPRRAEPGGEGEEKRLRLTLKVMADVGLVGFPNVGKSTLVAALSRARPKVADYPFTTLRPHLGVVSIGSHTSSASYVLADIPGLVPGASDGLGLGFRFLKHVERCRALLHLVAPPDDPLRAADEKRTPLKDYDALQKELANFAPELLQRPCIVAMSKSDLMDETTKQKAKRSFARRGIDLRFLSAATTDGLDALSRELYQLVKGHSADEDDPLSDAPRK